MTLFCFIVFSHLRLGALFPPCIWFSWCNCLLSLNRVSFPRARVALVQTHTFLAKVVEFAAKRERICAINEKKATDYNLQIILAEAERGRRGRFVPGPASREAFFGVQRTVRSGRKARIPSERARSSRRPSRRGNRYLMVPASSLPGPSCPERCHAELMPP